MITFIHTADWQIGKPYGQFQDHGKVATLQKARLDALENLAVLVRDHQVDAVLVCGDMFDSPLATRSVVCQTLEKIGNMPCPVYAIPGNHDHAGPGTVWQMPYFETERKALAPNLQVLIEERPVELDPAILLPCPLLQRQSVADPLGWLQRGAIWSELPPNKPRIILAHGTVQAFGADPDPYSTSNYLDLDQLPGAEIDYVALGDWHGLRQVGPVAWYSGTPEPDRFPRAADYRAGQALLVTVDGRGVPPKVQPVTTGQLTWAQLEVTLDTDSGVDPLDHRLRDLFGQAVGKHVVEVKLSGELGLEAFSALEELLEKYRARALELRVVQRVAVAPQAADLAALAERPSDPMIAEVANRLKKSLEQEKNERDRAALLALHRLVRELEET